MTCCGGGGASPTSLSTNATRVLMWNPAPNLATAPIVDGLSAGLTGTGTARAVAVGGAMLQTAARLGLVSAAAVDSVAGIRATNVAIVGGLAAQPTGRFKVQRWRAQLDFGISDAVLNANARMFVGVQQGVAAPVAVDPKTLVNAVGVGHNSGDGTLHLYATDAAGAIQVDQDLGFTFPIALNAFFRVVITNAGNATAGVMPWAAAVENLQTGARFSTIVQPVGPSAIATYGIRAWRSTGAADAAAVGIDIGACSIATDY
jgi:hypothetical protein